MLMLSRKASNALIAVTRALLLSGEIPQIESPNRENASYFLEFPGYRVSCNSSIKKPTKEMAFDNGGYGSVIQFKSDWRDLRNDLDPRFVIQYFERLTVRMQTNRTMDWADDEWYNFTSSNRPLNSWYPNATYDGQLKIIECRPVPSLYKVEISYDRTNRRIKYTTQDLQESIPSLYEIYVPEERDLAFWEDLQSNQTVYFPPTFDQILQLWDRWAILDASLRILEYSCAAEDGWAASIDRSNSGVVAWHMYINCEASSKSAH